MINAGILKLIAIRVGSTATYGLPPRWHTCVWRRGAQDAWGTARREANVVKLVTELNI